MAPEPQHRWPVLSYCAGCGPVVTGRAPELLVCASGLRMATPRSHPCHAGLLVGPGRVGLGAELLGGPGLPPALPETARGSGRQLTSSRIFFTVSPFWNISSDKGGGYSGFHHKHGRLGAPALEGGLQA